MFTVESILDVPPFGLEASAKRDLYMNALTELTDYHMERSPEFRQIARLSGYRSGCARRVEDFPFIPVRLFKEYELLSVDRSEIIKTMTSSGTTGQAVSKIFLDRATSTNQTKVLVKITATLTAGKRMPFLVVDSPAVVKDRNLFSARGAGLVGFSMLGRDTTYLLTNEYQVDYDALEAFRARHPGEQVLLFGFTFMIWEHLCETLRRDGKRLDLNGLLLHGGGWKKLASLQIDTAKFREVVHQTTGISAVVNYYGMVEQTGSIFLECEAGCLHASVFSDVIVRSPRTFEPLGPGETGIVQLVSLIPTSYPGHSILTEDLGEIVGVDDCPCGKKGTRFRIHGRVPKAELRGCSDTYAAGRASEEPR